MLVPLVTFVISVGAICEGLLIGSTFNWPRLARATEEIVLTSLADSYLRPVVSSPVRETSEANIPVNNVPKDYWGEGINILG